MRRFWTRNSGHAIMRLLYNRSLSTHPNPSLKKGGAPLRCKFEALSPSLFQGGGQGVGTLNAYARIVCGLLGLGQIGDMLAVSPWCILQFSL
jgi:hypothetical protein